MRICSFVLWMDRNGLSERTACWIKIQCFRGAVFRWQRNQEWLTVRKVSVGMRDLVPCAPKPAFWRVFSLELPPIRVRFQRQGIWVLPKMGTRVLRAHWVSSDPEPPTDRSFLLFLVSILFISALFSVFLLTLHFLCSFSSSFWYGVRLFEFFWFL